MTSSAKFRRYTAVERNSFLDQWQKSGLSQSEFCRQNGISLGQFYSWKHKLSINKVKLLPVTTSNGSAPMTSIASIKLTFPCGVSCQFVGCSDMNAIIQLIKDYEQCN